MKKSRGFFAWFISEIVWLMQNHILTYIQIATTKREVQRFRVRWNTTWNTLFISARDSTVSCFSLMIWSGTRGGRRLALPAVHYSVILEQIYAQSRNEIAKWKDNVIIQWTIQKKMIDPRRYEYQRDPHIVK